MKPSNILFLLLLLAATPCLAASPAIDPSFCAELVKHRPSADVAYQPGIDVHGKPVVPADLEGSTALSLPQTLSIPLSVDLAAFLGIDKASFPFNAMTRNDIKLGTLTLEGDKVLFEGHPLSSEQQENLPVLCLD